MAAAYRKSSLNTDTIPASPNVKVPRRLAMAASIKKHLGKAGSFRRSDSYPIAYNKGRRYRKLVRNPSPYPTFMSVDVCKNYYRKDRFERQGIFEYLTKGLRSNLKEIIGALVLEDTTSTLSLTDLYFNKKKFHKDSIQCTALPLSIDVDKVDFVDNNYYAETLPAKVVLGPCRTYSYLISAVKHAIRDLWLVTLPEAKESQNTKKNIFNYFGYHNLFSRRAAKILDQAKDDPLRVLRRFMYKNLCIADRRTNMLRASIEGNDEIAPGVPLSSLIRLICTPHLNAQDYWNKYEGQYGEGFANNAVSAFNLYITYLLHMRENSFLLDYKTPISYDMVSLHNSLQELSKDTEEILSEAGGNNLVVPNWRFYHPSALFPYLTCPWTRRRILHKLDFTKANKPSSMLCSDDIVENYFGANKKYPYLGTNNDNIGEENPSHVFDEDEYFSAYIKLPLNVYFPSTSSGERTVTSNDAMLIGERPEVVAAHVTYDGNYTPTIMDSIFPLSSLITPDELCFTRPLFSTAKSGTNTVLPEMVVASPPNYAFQFSKIELNVKFNPELGTRYTTTNTYELLNNSHNMCPTDQVIDTFAFQASALSSVDHIVTRFLKWVDDNFDVTTLPRGQQDVIKRFYKLSSLLAKHGSAKMLQLNLGNIVRSSAPLPDSDF